LVVVTVAAPEGDASTSQARIYVDGRLFEETTAIAPLQVQNPIFYLGRHNDDTTYGTRRFFAGTIRDARVYKQRLGPAEVAQLFANGPTTVAPARAAPDSGADGATP
jgi:hypothetical protein